MVFPQSKLPSMHFIPPPFSIHLSLASAVPKRKDVGYPDVCQLCLIFKALAFIYKCKYLKIISSMVHQNNCQALPSHQFHHQFALIRCGVVMMRMFAQEYTRYFWQLVDQDKDPTTFIYLSLYFVNILQPKFTMLFLSTFRLQKPIAIFLITFDTKVSCFYNFYITFTRTLKVISQTLFLVICYSRRSVPSKFECPPTIIVLNPYNFIASQLLVPNDLLVQNLSACQLTYIQYFLQKLLKYNSFNFSNCFKTRIQTLPLYNLETPPFLLSIQLQIQKVYTSKLFTKSLQRILKAIPKISSPLRHYTRRSKSSKSKLFHWPNI